MASEKTEYQKFLDRLESEFRAYHKPFRVIITVIERIDAELDMLLVNEPPVDAPASTGNGGNKQ